ncbi:CaiB/BaiF CoA transferase family protein [Mycolicibacterium holsaticum]|uniref:CaiB/BaiF CoA transferase family protein n=1 Tax=Mycolicibacterium holsaticum TaxID=152142 RepID=UPI001C7CDF40|nr:CoA transferase [Mycolicibacterium holsaticum]MDA4108130.1 acyl-CoA transferase [Mycolicibacterium holsaticum DSM 44478 = JCM 12374]QZA14458.1 CoA transferase [Mycolicibacterium holsaticum DSM 44478 = JCM 12374]UNC08093.1 CoA transferase [Mycolicibacterium holsaticum DSM 44478 = JCM 12374]
MTKVLQGVRVLEVALYGFVPAAASALSDWGADVVKIEHPETGDPIRGLAAFGVKPGDGGVTMLWEVLNRGKRCAGIDIAHPDGYAALMSLVDHADVFVTNFLGPARQRLRIDAEHIRARNPSIVYARGTGHGVRGPDADRGGFDGISYWARSGLATAAMPVDYDYPIGLPGPAVGDIQAGLNLAGGICGALYHRERTGEGAVVDASLLSSGLWAMQASIAGSYVTDRDQLAKGDRRHPGNPLANVYRTADDRFVFLAMLEADRYWPGFCRAVSRPHWVDDPRLASAKCRYKNIGYCVQLLDDLFVEHPLAHWKSVLSSQEGQWSVVQSPRETLTDEQAWDNDFFRMVQYDNGPSLPLVPVPVQFDETAAELTPAPGHGEHTDELLRACGYDDETIMNLKIAGAIT